MTPFQQSIYLIKSINDKKNILKDHSLKKEKGRNRRKTFPPLKIKLASEV